MNVVGIIIIFMISVVVAMVFYCIGYMVCEESTRKSYDNEKLTEIEDKVDDILNKLKGGEL